MTRAYQFPTRVPVPERHGPAGFFKNLMHVQVDHSAICTLDATHVPSKLTRVTPPPASKPQANASEQRKSDRARAASSSVRETKDILLANVDVRILRCFCLLTIETKRAWRTLAAATGANSTDGTRIDALPRRSPASA